MNQSKWDDKYQVDDYLFGTEPNTFLAEQFRAIPKGKVLCLADGEGRNSVFLAQQGYEVTAVDMSLVGINKAKFLAQEKSVEINFVHANLKDFDMGKNCWHGIVSIFCHVPVALRQQLHTEVVAGLNEGGVFLLEAYTPDQLRHGTGGPPNIDLLMSTETLRNELDGLKMERLVELERDVREGASHAGPSSVVQLCARKPIY